LDGVNKMSKSLGNYVGITDPPDEMLGRLMSISDDLMWRYFELLSFRSIGEIERLRREADEGRNPRDIKLLLAKEIVERFHGAAAAASAEERFFALHRDKALPDDLPTVRVPVQGRGLEIAYVLKAAGLVSSTSEALRFIDQGAVRVDGERIEDRALTMAAGETHVYQVGRRRFAKISLQANER
jgi:tyrosyl-tRNA synthetase